MSTEFKRWGHRRGLGAQRVRCSSMVVRSRGSTQPPHLCLSKTSVAFSCRQPLSASRSSARRRSRTRVSYHVPFHQRSYDMVSAGTEVVAKYEAVPVDLCSVDRSWPHLRGAVRFQEFEWVNRMNAATCVCTTGNSDLVGMTGAAGAESGRMPLCQAGVRHLE